jgi:hypothetical protein
MKTNQGGGAEKKLPGCSLPQRLSRRPRGAAVRELPVQGQAPGRGAGSRQADLGARVSPAMAERLAGRHANIVL